jgi:hypothetical protein
MPITPAAVISALFKRFMGASGTLAAKIVTSFDMAML